MTHQLKSKLIRILLYYIHVLLNSPVKLCKIYNVAILFMIWCSVWSIRDCWLHIKCLWIQTWRVFNCTRKRGTLFDVVVVQLRLHKKAFVIYDACLTPLCQHVQLLFVQHMDRIKHVALILKFFVPFASLCGVVGSPSWFAKCLIGRTGNIWTIMYIDDKFKLF